MDPVEKAIRAVEQAAGKPASEARKTAREQSDKERLKRADEPWNKLGPDAPPLSFLPATTNCSLR